MGLSSAPRDRVDTSHGPILYLEDITVSSDAYRDWETDRKSVV